MSAVEDNLRNLGLDQLNVVSVDATPMLERTAIARMDRQIKAQRQIAIKPVRIHVATPRETPKPVARAIYAATHIGHFGSAARTAVGRIHFAEPIADPMIRRVLDFPFAVLDVAWQQHECFAMASHCCSSLGTARADLARSWN